MKLSFLSFAFCKRILFFCGSRPPVPIPAVSVRFCTRLCICRSRCF
uniref:Uncharacterized protein n=1 Tax=Faecalibaculum rodentium TaxID=1702221 RepID=A0A140DRN6_9FIRM|nr:hypothetical protein AALO17_01790 [Faecalibaculum rodentium]